MVPYHTASPCTSEDDFNFYYSSARIQVECDVYNSAGRPSLHENDERINGLKIRDKLRQSLLDREMRSPRKSEWDTDTYMHVNSI